MTQFSAVIVEDEPFLLQSLTTHLATLWPDLDTTRTAKDGIEAVRLIGERMPDIVFLDIHLPGLNGLEVARLVSGRAHVVFVTAHANYAAAAFEEGALDFVVKPIVAERLAVTTARLRQRVTQPPADVVEALRRLTNLHRPDYIRWIQATAGNQIKFVPTEDVIYFQADAKYTKVVSKRGECHIRRTIKELCESLDPELFWQVHRSTIVQASMIDSVTRSGESMTLKLVGCADKLPVSLPYQGLFRQRG
ncbi:MAG: LytR/AlgR family response regulator transcription factor [Burkholderiales bacterium]|jgi:DNA-binding LytR/AlgR family response regulator